MAKKLPPFLVRQKYRFDIGQGFLAVINFAVIVLAASDKIATLVQLPAKVIVPLSVPLAVGVVWLIGFVLDKMEFMQAYQAEQNKRNAMLSAVHLSVSGATRTGQGEP